MAIIKNFEGVNGFAKMRQDTVLADKNLSWKAKGIWSYLMSKPPEWIIYTSELVTHSSDGRASLMKGIQELIDNNYVERIKTRNKNGFAGCDYRVYDVKIPDVGKRADTKRANRKSTNRKRADRKPVSTISADTKPTPSNNDISNNDNTNNDINKMDEIKNDNINKDVTNELELDLNETDRSDVQLAGKKEQPARSQTARTNSEFSDECPTDAFNELERILQENPETVWTQLSEALNQV